MKIYVVRSLIGAFGLDTNGKLIDHVLFPKDANLAAQKIVETGIIPEEKDLITKLKKKNYTVQISGLDA